MHLIDNPGSCLISLRFTSQIESLEDIETWRNIRNVVSQIIDQCVGVPVTGAPLGTGGGESCGTYIRALRVTSTKER